MQIVVQPGGSYLRLDADTTQDVDAAVYGLSQHGGRSQSYPSNRCLLGVRGLHHRPGGIGSNLGERFQEAYHPTQLHNYGERASCRLEV
jgi:hypothetical protein